VIPRPYGRGWGANAAPRFSRAFSPARQGGVWSFSPFRAVGLGKKLADVTVAPLTSAAMVLTYSVKKVLSVLNFVEFCFVEGPCALPPYSLFLFKRTTHSLCARP
jgi:hypothetical protein